MYHERPVINGSPESTSTTNNNNNNNNNDNDDDDNNDNYYINNIFKKIKTSGQSRQTLMYYP